MVGIGLQEQTELNYVRIEWLTPQLLIHLDALIVPDTTFVSDMLFGEDFYVNYDDTLRRPQLQWEVYAVAKPDTCVVLPLLVPQSLSDNAARVMYVQVDRTC